MEKAEAGRLEHHDPPTRIAAITVQRWPFLDDFPSKSHIVVTFDEAFGHPTVVAGPWLMVLLRVLGKARG